MKVNKMIGTNLMIIGFILIVLISLGNAAPEDDKIAGLPGYPDNFDASVYAGYLKTSS